MNNCSDDRDGPARPCPRAAADRGGGEQGQRGHKIRRNWRRGPYIFWLDHLQTKYKYATWSAKRSTTVTAPAGKAGLLFDATATPPTVTGLAALSPLRGEVQVGWKLEKVDDVDVSEMTGAAATRLLEERAANARRLTFDRTLPPLPNYEF